MKKHQTKKYFGFTLVELIIVITILAILATISFVSFQNYTTQTRDTNRLTSIKTIEKGLQVYFGVNDKYPTPDFKVDILASGSVIGYQGYAGDNVLNIIKSSKTLDPLDGKYYTYSVNKTLTKYELMVLTESPSAISYLPQTFASSRYAKVFGDKIGIITDTNNIPIQDSGTGVDVVNTSLNYKAFISNGLPEVNGTGSELSFIGVSMGNNYSKNCLETYRAGLGNGNGIYNINPFGTGNINVYCNMTDNGGGWTGFYGLNSANVGTFTGGIIPGNFDYGSFSGNLWSSNLKNFKFSKFMIGLYDSSGNLFKSYDYNMVSQTGFNLTTNSNFIVDNILYPEPDCEFRFRYRSGYGAQSWQVGINDLDNAAMDATCAVGTGFNTLGQYVMISRPDNKNFSKTIFYIK